LRKEGLSDVVVYDLLFFLYTCSSWYFFSLVIIPASDEYVNIKYNICMDMKTKVTLHNWLEPAAKQEIKRIRYDVFVVEQKVPPEEELDAFDAVSLHILVHTEIQDGTFLPVATGRLLPDGHIGRVAVMKPFRKMGIGSLIMTELEKQAIKRGMVAIELDAQLQAVPFYNRLGYSAFGNIFTDAGILHRKMRKKLSFQNDENV